MGEARKCEYCGRPIKSAPVNKVLRGRKHTYCSEFCFRLFFYDVPRITYEDLQELYRLRCFSVQVPDFSKLIARED